MQGQQRVPVSCLYTPSAQPLRISGLRSQKSKREEKKVGTGSLRLRREIGWNKPSFAAHHFLPVRRGLSWEQALPEGLVFLSPPQVCHLVARKCPAAHRSSISPGLSVDLGVLILSRESYVCTHVVLQLLYPVLNFLWSCKHEFLIISYRFATASHWNENMSDLTHF